MFTRVIGVVMTMIGVTRARCDLISTWVLTEMISEAKSEAAETVIKLEKRLNRGQVLPFA